MNHQKQPTLFDGESNVRAAPGTLLGREQRGLHRLALLVSFGRRKGRPSSGEAHLALGAALVYRTLHVGATRYPSVEASNF